MPSDADDETPIHCTGCGRQIGVAESPNSDLFETGEVAREVRLQASVDSPVASINVVLGFRCEKCREGDHE